MLEDVTMLEVRAATDGDLESAAELMAEAFSYGNAAEYEEILSEVRRTAHEDPASSLDDLRVGILDEVVVSAVAIRPKSIHVSGSVLSLGGVAGVCTRESHRGAGYNTAVLRDAIAYIERQAHDISLLYTGINGYYERLGWRTFDHVMHHRVAVPDGSLATPFTGSVRAVAADDLPAMRAIYNTTNVDKAGPVVRDGVYWAYYTPSPESYHVAVADDHAVAYLRDRGAAHVEEIGYLPGREDAACALIADALAHGRAAGVDTVEMVGVASVLPHIRALGCAVEDIPSSATMYRVTALGPLIGKLLGRMTRRLAVSAVSRWSAVVRLQSEVGTVDLRCSGGVVTRIEGHSAPSITLVATHSQVIELVFGQIDAASLATADPGPDSTAVLTALFPRLEYRYYGPDTF